MASRSSSAFLFLFALVQSGARLRGSELERFEAVEPHMGSIVRIVVYAPDRDSAKRAFEAAFARVAALDGILSDYKPDSELSRLCVARTAVVSPDLFRVLDASQRLAKESDGAFDVTAGPMIRLWREARKTGILPDPKSLEAAQGRSGWRKLTLDQRTRNVRLSQADMALDVGGIAKGFVAGEAVEALKRHGIRSALVAASGDIVVSDPPPGKSSWELTVELLDGTRDIRLSNAAVSTAGDTEQFMEAGGKRYSHIIDPATGMALTKRIAVSVIAPTGLEADGLDTAISVLGVDRGIELLKRYRAAKALIVTEDRAWESPAFGR